MARTEVDASHGGLREPRMSDPQPRTVLVVLGDDSADRPGFMLGDARLSLGAGAEDDVYLNGVGVVPGHLRLVFLEGRITLLSAVEEVRVDGQAVDTYPFDVQPQQVISLSPDTHLAYGPAGSPWPAAPPWPMAAESAEVAAAQAEPAPGAASLARGVQPMTKRARVIHGARWAALGLAAATVVVVGLVAADLAWGIRESVIPGEVAIERSEDALKKLLASDPQSYRSVLLTVRGDGALALTGFVDSEDAYQKLAQQVRQQTVSSGGNVRMDVLTAGRLEALVRDSLVRFPLVAHLEVGAESILVTVSGVKLEKDVMDRVEVDLQRLASRTLPRKLEFDYRLQDAYKFVQEVSRALLASPATRDLTFEIDERGGRITGFVPAAVESEAVAAALHVKRTFESQVPLRIDLKVDAKLNFNVVSLTQGGDAPSATLVQRGQVQTFRLGDMVFGVGELLDIRSDGVKIAVGRREVFMPLSR